MTARMSRKGRVYAELGEESMTEQSHKEQVQIKNILKRYSPLDEQRRNNLSYVDVVSVPEFQAAMMIVAAGNNAFEELPVEVRQAYNFDPVAFLVDVDQEEPNQVLYEYNVLERPEPKKTPGKPEGLQEPIVDPEATPAPEA